MTSEYGRLQELLELNRTTRGRSLTFNEVSRSSGSIIIEGGGIYLMWDPSENRWVRVGETETFWWRWQDHWKWGNSNFPGHVGHAMCHSSGRENLIPFLYLTTWNGLPEQVRENLQQLRADIKQYVANWTITWVRLPERQMGLRLFLEANLIATFSKEHRATEQWMGRSLAICNCCVKQRKKDAKRITQSQLWNVEDLVDGTPTPDWLRCLEKQIV
jgi:hypothetical protein